MSDKGVLFCCTELASYLRKSIISFSERYKIHCHIICSPPSKDAPYHFKKHQNITIYNKEKLSIIELYSICAKINPSAIHISGWIEKDSLLIARKYRSIGVPVIMSLDNHWIGSLKQIVGARIAKVFFPMLFSHIWIPGKPQKLFAYKLGFKETQILTGFYAADVAHFRQGYLPNKVFRNILFLGRLVPYKRPVELLNIFQLLSKENKSWTLTFIGNGECKKYIQEKILGDNQIRLIDFIQPDDLIEEIRKASVFCLPSTREHWGLVVQESCAAGKLLLTSDQVGAASDFLVSNYNGFMFKSEDLNDLRRRLKQILEMTDEEIIQFQKRSFDLEQKNRPEVWADKLYKVINTSEY
jgi:glycosyltransferase involved in cell wall biosynthesis